MVNQFLRLSIQFFAEDPKQEDPAPKTDDPKQDPKPDPKQEEQPLTIEEVAKQYQTKVADLEKKIADRDATIRLLMNGDGKGGQNPQRKTEFEKMLRI